MRKPVFDLWNDILFAARSLWRRPRYAVGIVVVLAVGIGTTVGIFTYFSYLHFSFIQAPSPEEVFWIRGKGDDAFGTGLSFADFRELDKDALGLAELTGGRVFGASLRRADRNTFHWGRGVEGDYFQLFGSRPHLGRLLNPADDRAGAEPVLVLSHLLWTRQFNADPDIVGTTVDLVGLHPATVVGVAPKGFQGAGLATAFYVPIAQVKTKIIGLDDPKNVWTAVLARVAEGVSPAEVRERIASFSSALDEHSPRADGPRELFLSPAESFSGPQLSDDPLVRGSRLLMAAVMLFLSLACFNVANLMAARAEARRRELSIHASLGAGSFRIVRRLLLEGLMLAALGGALGTLLTHAVVKVLNGYLISANPVGLGDWGAGSSIHASEPLARFFLISVTLAVAVLSSTLPVRSVLRRNLVAGLTRTSDQGPGGGRRLGRALVVFQMALSVMLVFGATLLVRTFITVTDRDLGFSLERRYVTMVHFPEVDTADAEHPQQLNLKRFDELLQEIRQMPGVRSAASLTHVPPGYLRSAEMAGESGGETLDVTYNTVSDGYFETLEIPLLMGRDFGARDREATARTVVVNQLAADALWPNQDSLGKSLWLLDGQEQTRFEVIGVSAPAHDSRLDLDTQPTVYFHYHQRGSVRFGVLAHAQGPYLASFARFLRDRYPDLSIRDAQPLAEQARRAGVDQKMHSELSSALAVFGLMLAAIGVFGVTSHDVGRRRREIAVRRAMGATRASIRGLVLKDTGKLLMWGLGLGWLGAWMSIRWIRSMIFGVEPLDLWSFGITAVCLVLVAFTAVWFPARQASRTEIVKELGRQ